MDIADGKWIARGLKKDDPNRIKTPNELTAYIEETGFLPLFSGAVPGFSVEEKTAADYWFTGEAEDPWDWRAVLAGEHNIAYGKFFGKGAGFISKKWFPLFASYRRNGYDFDSLYEDGKAPRRLKLIMDVLESEDADSLFSYEIKAQAGFGKGGEKGFEAALTNLQMQTYLTTMGFEKKKNKAGAPYGWPVALYGTPETLFGKTHVISAYDIPAEEAKDRIITQVQRLYPKADLPAVQKLIR